MTKEEIFEYNKNVHKFLGYEFASSDKDFYFVEHPINKNLRELNFDRKYIDDWNFIMEVVDAIEKNIAYVKIKGCAVDVSTISNLNAPTKKEAVVKAINEILIWNNKQNHV